MDISVFQVLGPIMIGPSSSHTAGAAKLARIAATIAGNGFYKVEFGLHGSFAKTGLGHGTDKALVAGVLNMKEDDEEIKNSFLYAQKRNIEIEFIDIELENAHENSVKFTFYYKNSEPIVIIGSSIGGGEILITNIKGFETSLSLQRPVILITHKDEKGVIRDVSDLLANEEINIGTMTLSRKEKGGEASCIIETDSEVSDLLLENLKKIKNIKTVISINV